MDEQRPNRLPAEDRYHRDPVFHNLVDWMVYHVRNADYTPTEMREAAMLAMTIHERTTLRRPIVGLREEGEPFNGR